MKNSTALKQSKASARFLAVVVPIAWAFTVWSQTWQFAVLAGFMTLYLIGELINIRVITKAAAQNPEYLKKRIS